MSFQPAASSHLTTTVKHTTLALSLTCTHSPTATTTTTGTARSTSAEGRRGGSAMKAALTTTELVKKKPPNVLPIIQLFTHFHHLPGSRMYEYLDDSGDE